MSKSHWALAEEQALVGQIHVLDSLVKMRGGRVPTKATPPGAWRYTCDGQAEYTEDFTVPLQLLLDREGGDDGD